MIRFVGKSGRYLNVLGERVTAAQVSEALTVVDGSLIGFTVSVRMGETPSYVIAFEGEMNGESLVSVLDEGLAKANVEYASKRKSGRLGAPEWRRLPTGHYAQYRRVLNAKGAPDGQLKDPVLAVNRDEWVQLLMGEVDE